LAASGDATVTGGLHRRFVNYEDTFSGASIRFLGSLGGAGHRFDDAVMKPFPPTETNDSLQGAPAGVFVFWGRSGSSFSRSEAQSVVPFCFGGCWKARRHRRHHGNEDQRPV